MGQAIVQVDAFTEKPFAGNPAAVCVLDAPQPDDWLQQVALEMNLSETAFLLPQADGYDLRWFTPAAEVPLCGHATLASAHVLWSEGHVPTNQEIRFHTLSGLLTANRQGEWIELNFPVQPMQVVEPPDTLLAALGITDFAAVRHRTRQNQDDYLIELASEDDVRQLRPNFTQMLTLSTRGAIVTSRGTQYDFVSRYFAPGVGINEDPVTGYAHCCLAPYWQERLGKTEFLAYQASARGGVVKVRLAGDRVLLAGQAVTVLRGELV